MRVFNESKTEVLTSFDLAKGYLKPDRLFVRHYKAVKEVKGVFHYRTVRTYPNGGKHVVKVWDVKPRKAREAFDKYEDIQVYVPYTEEELARITQERYERRVGALLRERYSLDAELAILRQRDTKPEEFAAYNAYAEECKKAAKAELVTL